MHCPFLAERLKEQDFTLVPIIVGATSPSR